MISFILKLVFKFNGHLVLFVTIVLLCFVLGGCVTSTTSFSSIYIADMRLNSSVQGNNTATSIISKSNSTIDDIVVKVGYMGICVDSNNQTSCTSIQNLNDLGTYFNVNNDLSKSLLLIAKNFTNICRPYVLITVVLLNLILFFSSFLTIMVKLPLNTKLKIINCALSLLIVLLWGLGAMLQTEAMTAATQLLAPASLNIIQSSAGKKCSAMSWTAFGFNTYIFVHNMYTFWKEKKIESNVNDNDTKAKLNDYY